MQCGDALIFRSYGPAGHSHSHDHLQLVLPVHGSLALEIEGRGGHLDTLHGALVVPGALHVQAGDGRNRFLVVDCDSALLAPSVLDRGRSSPFLRISPALRSLLGFIDLRASGQSTVTTPMAQHALPLLLDALFTASPAPVTGGSCLRRLCEQIRDVPGQAWPLTRMAQVAGIGLTALHAAFKREYGLSPAQWLLQQRLQLAQRQLAAGQEPLAQIALQAGFSDQGAFTRAMRRSLGITPGRYRRRLDA